MSSSSDIYSINKNKVIKLKRQKSATAADTQQNSSATRPSVPSVKLANFQTFQQSGTSPARQTSGFRNGSKVSQNSRNTTKPKDHNESRNEYFAKTMQISASINAESLKKIILAN